MEVLGLIPARKGSKSIKDKNLALVNGKILIEYVLDTAVKSGTITRILCSTDDERIMAICDERRVIVQKRPEYLAQDDSTIQEVVEYVLKEFPADIVVLLQPTSPFILPGHIDECVTMLKNESRYASAQTIARPPHNHHAFNQRIIKPEKNSVEFCFGAERKIFYNKQLKPEFYIFGNIVATRTKNIKKGGLFPVPSFPVEIPYPYAMDIDQPEDIKLAEWYLNTGQVCGF